MKALIKKKNIQKLFHGTILKITKGGIEFLEMTKNIMNFLNGLIGNIQILISKSSTQLSCKKKMYKNYELVNHDRMYCTSNLSYLLPAPVLINLQEFKYSEFEKVFGPGDMSLYEPERGYIHPEWYWEDENYVWGIGWRFEQPRLRGCRKNNTWSSPSAVEAIKFVTFINESLYNNSKEVR